MNVKTITIRGIDEDLKDRLRETARESGDSLNTTILKLLRSGLNLDRKPPYPEYHDLDGLAGTWTAKDREEFDRFQEGFNRIDEEMWS
jgi:plasmid stability protein